MTPPLPITPLHPAVAFLYPLENIRKPRGCLIFRVYKKATLDCNGLSEK